MKTYKRILLFLLLCTLSVSAALAQKTLIRGTIMDGTFDEPLAGANVVWQNKDGRTVTGAQTDFNGNFSLAEMVRPGDVLVVSFTGYKKQTLPITTSQTVYNLTMVEETVALKDVEVTAARRQNSGMMRHIGWFLA